MNILEVIPSIDATAGGPVESLKQFAAIAQAEGHHIEAASLDAPDAECVRNFPLTVHACGPAKLGAYGYAPRFLAWMRTYVHAYDIVVVNGIWAYHSFATWRAMRGSNTPYVVHAHGMLDPWFKQQYPLKHMKKWLYWPWAEYRVLRDANSVLFTCEEEKLLARESFWLYHCNEVIFSAGTSGSPGCRESQTRAFLNRFPKLAGKRLALFLGRIHPKKGCDLAIQAFARVMASDPDWQLVIAGPDEVGWKREITALSESLSLRDRITWTGMLSGDEKWGAMSASEVFLLPSHQENFGLVVAEALAQGLPVLISRKVNIWREVLEDGAGLAADDTLDGVCELLQGWLAMEPAERKRMSESASECFLSRFEIGKTARSQLEFLARITEVRQPHGRAPDRLKVAST